MWLVRNIYWSSLSVLKFASQVRVGSIGGPMLFSLPKPAQVQVCSFSTNLHILQFCSHVFLFNLEKNLFVWLVLLYWWRFNCQFDINVILKGVCVSWWRRVFSFRLNWSYGICLICVHQACWRSSFWMCGLKIPMKGTISGNIGERKGDIFCISIYINWIRGFHNLAHCFDISEQYWDYSERRQSVKEPSTDVSNLNSRLKLRLPYNHACFRTVYTTAGEILWHTFIGSSYICKLRGYNSVSSGMPSPSKGKSESSINFFLRRLALPWYVVSSLWRLRLY